MRFKRIFCAFDELAGSAAALGMATDLARQGAQLLIARAIERESVLTDIGHVPNATEVADEVMAASEHELELLRRSLANKIPGAEVVTLGGSRTWRSLTTEAARWKADLLVVGAGCKRNGGVGEVTEQVLHHAPCPVLVVSGAARPIGRLLCATDFSEPSRHAWSAALELAEERNAELGLVYAVSERDGAAEAAVRRWAENVEPGLRSRIVAAVIEGPAGESVVEAARRGNYDLIVVGTRGRSGVARALLGSVAEDIVRRADRPVLLVH